MRNRLRSLRELRVRYRFVSIPCIPWFLKCSVDDFDLERTGDFELDTKIADAHPIAAKGRFILFGKRLEYVLDFLSSFLVALDGGFKCCESGEFFNNLRCELDAAVTNTASLLSRNVWRKRLASVGENAFRYELYLFWCDLRAGEEVHSRPRAFTARLNNVISASERSSC